MNMTPRYQQISAQDFLALGVDHVAYVKPAVIDGQALFAVYAADGTQVAVLPTRDQADIAVRRNDMEPLSVH